MSVFLVITYTSINAFDSCNWSLFWCQGTHILALRRWFSGFEYFV